MSRQIRLLAFDMASVGHIQQGMWRHPRDRSAGYLDLDRWTSLARTLERGLFDGLFLADVLGVYDVYRGGPEAAIRGAVQIPNGDPLLLVSAMAAATQHLGFGVTVNLGAEAPALLARRFSTLDHLTRGRIAWNIVTGYLDSAARALGQGTQAAHDDRYDRADATLDALYALWEGSWAEDAVVMDRTGDMFADPSRVRPVLRDDPAARLDAIHLVSPSPQRTPLLFQAGASARGRAFAARHAECVFVNGTTPAQVATIVADLRARAVAEGREARDLTVFVGATIVLGETDEAAAALLAEYRAVESKEAALAHASGSLGIDFAALDPDAQIPTAGGPAGIASNREAASAMTPRRFADNLILGGRQRPIVGSAATVADTLQTWVEQADVDGFMLARTVTPECFEAVVDLLVPELQRRGLYKTAYADGAWRAKLTGAPRLPARHVAAKHRQW